MVPDSTALSEYNIWRKLIPEVARICDSPADYICLFISLLTWVLSRPKTITWSKNKDWVSSAIYANDETDRRLRSQLQWNILPRVYGRSLVSAGWTRTSSQDAVRRSSTSRICNTSSQRGPRRRVDWFAVVLQFTTSASIQFNLLCGMFSVLIVNFLCVKYYF